jgi:predicted nucleic-acid-binding protein
MGLIDITDPVQLDSDLLLESRRVIIAYTDLEMVKLYFTTEDSKQALEDLMDKEGVNVVIKKAILKSIGFKEHSSSTHHADLSQQLPGVNLIVKHPVTGENGKLWSTVIDLNDMYKWKREDIADWIENVADIKDIAFPVPQGVNNEAGKLSKFAKVVKIKRILSR